MTFQSQRRVSGKLRPFTFVSTPPRQQIGSLRLVQIVERWLKLHSCIKYLVKSLPSRTLSNTYPQGGLVPIRTTLVESRRFGQCLPSRSQTFTKDLPAGVADRLAVTV